MKFDRPIAIAFMFFAILLLVFFLVAPEYTAFKKLRQDLGEAKAEYNAKFDYYTEITKKYYELQNRQESLVKIDNALPENPDLGKIVYYFQDTAGQSGLIVRDVFLSGASASVKSSSNKKNETLIKDIIFSMDLMGSYSSLGTFLKTLEKSDRIFEVTNISFGSQGIPQSKPQAEQKQTDKLQPKIQQIYTFTLRIKTQSY